MLYTQKKEYWEHRPVVSDQSNYNIHSREGDTNQEEWEYKYFVEYWYYELFEPFRNFLCFFEKIGAIIKVGNMLNEIKEKEIYKKTE